LIKLIEETQLANAQRERGGGDDTTILRGYRNGAHESARH
jgi:hypothetical protein